ncbi:uncharacterized protein LOC126996880 [Eriocheir sinensis]|uniref:uncharacterized protein LOC126996880 n=1 Tax=Eriocheir sinensis TaxID=95602 RepID=UPI0021C72AE3|nr:uncharacterized protein LOC126996880 [Eriocheir sinensis]XP_050713756.1 uncharacterized protein LOC126996880 [Eriocheir sinensis]
MRLALGCVLVLPAALHLLLCHAPAAAADTATDADMHADARQPTPHPPLAPPRQPRQPRHDPLLGLGLLAGLPRLLSLTPQDTPLSSQLLDALTLPYMQRHPHGSLTPLASPLQRASTLQDLREIGSFPLDDFKFLQALLNVPDGGFGHWHGGVSRKETGRRDDCSGRLPSEDAPCPSTLLQILSGRVPRPPEVPPPPRRPPVFPWTPLSSSSSSSSSASAADAAASSPHWLKTPPSKRYLGIELPDYIATSYSSIKTDNAHYLTKLHQLKQRMRNAGK